MEDEQIEAVKNWPELTSVRDIQVFIGFANFYRRFIQGFSRIAAPLTSMLKTTGSSKELAPKAFRADDNEIVGGGDGSETIRNSSRKSTRMPNIGAIGEPNFLTPDAKKAFNHLRLAFIKAPILRHFDLESHIRIKTDASGYAIGGVLSQLNLNSDVPPNDSNSNKSDFGQWHPVAYFSRKMIPAETRYETHDAELLAIVEAFKTWRHYLEGCKHEVLVLTDHNNLRRFMDTKSLSSHQVRWAQELSRYHFRIDYRQGKANGAADALARFPQRSLDEEEKLRVENSQILHRLQSSLTRASLSDLSLFRLQSFRSQPRLRAQSLTLPPSPHLRYSRAPPTALFLGHVSSQTSRRKSLYGQYRRNEVEASRTARIRCRGSENQNGRAEKKSGRIRRRRWGAASPGATLRA